MLSQAPYRAMLFLEGHGEESDGGEEQQRQFLSSLARGAFSALAALPAAAAADASSASSPSPSAVGGEPASSDPFDAAATLGPGAHVRGARYRLQDLAGGLGWATPSAKADTAGGGSAGGALGGALASLRGSRTLTQREAALGAAASEGLGWEGESGDAEVLLRPAGGGGGGGGKAAATTAATTAASATPLPSAASSGGTWACASRCGARSLNFLLRPGGVRGGDDAAAAAAALAAFAERRCGGGLE